MADPLDLDALSLARALRDGSLSPTEVLDTTLAAAETTGTTLGAFVTLTPDRARDQARTAQRTLTAARRDGSTDSLPPFLGVPCPVKDLSAVAGVPLGAGSHALTGYVSDHDDGVVTRLRDAGTIMIGTTTTPEFGLPCYTEPDTGPPARTPWDTTRSAGGSSGGAAAAVAGGVVPVAHGSDGGGSLRIPASACGLVGLKPSRGVVSNGPFGIDGPGLGSHGVLTRTVRDTAAFLDVLARPWPGETFAVPPGPSYLAACDETPRRQRVGLLTRPVVVADAPVDPACVAATHATAALLAELGHDVVEIEPPFPAEQWESFTALWAVGALLAPVPPEREDELVPLTRWLRDIGRRTTGADYAQALGCLQTLTREVARAWAHVDVVVSPTLAQLPAPVGGQRRDDDPARDFADQKTFTPWTSLWNLTGRPAISLPLGETTAPARDGGGAAGTGSTATGIPLPVGVMLGARHGDDRMLLALAARLEEAAPWVDRRPPVHARALHSA